MARVRCRPHHGPYSHLPISCRFDLCPMQAHPACKHVHESTRVNPRTACSVHHTPLPARIDRSSTTSHAYRPSAMALLARVINKPVGQPRTPLARAALIACIWSMVPIWIAAGRGAVRARIPQQLGVAGWQRGRRARRSEEEGEAPARAGMWAQPASRRGALRGAGRSRGTGGIHVSMLWPPPESLFRGRHDPPQTRSGDRPPTRETTLLMPGASTHAYYACSASLAV
jgi:hypothetical protein